jgi:hypothetical protein
MGMEQESLGSVRELVAMAKDKGSARQQMEELARLYQRTINEILTLRRLLILFHTENYSLSSRPSVSQASFMIGSQPFCQIGSSE